MRDRTVNKSIARAAKHAKRFVYSLILLLFLLALNPTIIKAAPYGTGGYGDCPYQQCQSSTDTNTPGGSTNNSHSGSNSNSVPGTPNTGGWFQQTGQNIQNTYHDVYHKPGSYWWLYLALIASFILLILLFAKHRRDKERE